MGLTKTTKTDTKTKSEKTERQIKAIDEGATTARRELGKGLTGVLAETYMLYNTTQFYHWNVEGPHFFELHETFEKQYRELAEAIDLLAERIRVLGYYTPGTLTELLELARMQQQSDRTDPQKMVTHLMEGHQQVAHRIREVLGLSEKLADEATTDMLVERLRRHEKSAWMLRSQSGKRSDVLSLAPTKRAAS